MTLKGLQNTISVVIKVKSTLSRLVELKRFKYKGKIIPPAVGSVIKCKYD